MHAIDVVPKAFCRRLSATRRCHADMSAERAMWNQPPIHRIPPNVRSPSQRGSTVLSIPASSRQPSRSFLIRGSNDVIDPGLGPASYRRPLRRASCVTNERTVISLAECCGSLWIADLPSSHSHVGTRQPFSPHHLDHLGYHIPHPLFVAYTSLIFV